MLVEARDLWNQALKEEQIGNKKAPKEGAGEIEARDAASRRKMTAEERRNRMPDMGDKNTVFPEDATKKRAPELKVRDGIRYSISRPLTESDLQDYLRAGKRRNKNKQEALDRGEKIILTSDKEIRDYIDAAIHGNVDLPTVAYAKVSSRLSAAVKMLNSDFDIEDYYLELVASDLRHSYVGHLKAKEKVILILPNMIF